MIRACKALLCTLAADVATVSFAARLQVEKSSAVTNVMDRIGALLETRGHADAEVLKNLRVIASQVNTPGATESLNSALSKVISEIEQNVQTKIKASHKDTQAAINTNIDDLKAATTEAVDHKKIADDLDSSWFTCVGDEKAKRLAIEEAEEALDKSESNVGAPCKLQEDRKMFSSEPSAAGLKFDCDISAHGNCDKQMQSYRSQINGMLAGVQTDATKHTNSWTQAKGYCDAAKADVVAKQEALEGATAAWSAQSHQCMTKHESRQISLCLFGTVLQHKCAKVSAYRNLMEGIKKVNGGEYSHTDRAQEWKTTVVTTCMLSKIVAGAEINDATLDSCEGSVNFDQDVGVLSKQEEVFADLTSSAKFTCSERSITFGGETWEMPTGTAPASSGYTANPFHPEVSLAEDLAPFAFCEQDATGAPQSQCEPQALAACAGNSPCIDLREGEVHHHLMWLIGDGTAHVVGGASNFSDDRTWECTCSGGCTGLVGEWVCPGFYEDQPIVISSEFGDDFTKTRSNDHIDVCA